MYGSATLEATMKEVLEYIYAPPPSPRPFYDDQLNATSLGEADSPFTAAAGFLLLGLHYCPPSAVDFGPVGFMASQATHALAVLRRVTPAPKSFTAVLARLERAIDDCFKAIEAKYDLPRARFLVGGSRRS
jgi:hypothetical protein